MKKYIAPKIKAVKLDQESAILAVCEISGSYMGSSALLLCVKTGGGGFPPGCQFAAKAAARGSSMRAVSAESAPS
ncbi:MAG: hypothetical protein PHQ52_06950 [Candidatus Omnitrophica bacterium]|nr:hypothetical protein [Candidatus Omnitrophota bacterium]